MIQMKLKKGRSSSIFDPREFIYLYSPMFLQLDSSLILYEFPHRGSVSCTVSTVQDDRSCRGQRSRRRRRGRGLSIAERRQV